MGGRKRAVLDGAGIAGHAGDLPERSIGITAEEKGRTFRRVLLPLKRLVLWDFIFRSRVLFVYE